MADQAAVEDSIVALVAGALYPQGTTSPSAAGGIPVKVFRGWPVGKALDDDMKAGKALVSLTSMGMGGPVMQFLNEERVVPRAPWPMTATLTETVSGLRVTLAGASEAGLCVGVRVLKVPYVAALLPGDTPSTAATKLAALVPGAVATGPFFDMPYAPGVEARVGGRVVSRMEIEREEEHYRLAVWASSPMARDAVARVVASVVKRTDWIAIEGEEDARLQYRGTTTVDDAAESRVFRKDVNVRAEFGTYDDETVPTVLFGVAVVSPVAFVEG